MEKTIFKCANVNDRKVLALFREHLIIEYEKQRAYKQIDARTSRLVKSREIANAKAETYGYMIECLKAIEFSTVDK